MQGGKRYSFPVRHTEIDRESTGTCMSATPLNRVSALTVLIAIDISTHRHEMLIEVRGKKRRTEEPRLCLMRGKLPIC